MGNAMVTANPAIDRTNSGGLRLLPATPYVERKPSQAKASVAPTSEIHRSQILADRRAVVLQGGTGVDGRTRVLDALVHEGLFNVRRRGLDENHQ